MAESNQSHSSLPGGQPEYRVAEAEFFCRELQTVNQLFRGIAASLSLSRSLLGIRKFQPGQKSFRSPVKSNFPPRALKHFPPTTKRAAPSFRTCRVGRRQKPRRRSETRAKRVCARSFLNSRQILEKLAAKRYIPRTCS